MGAVNLPMTSGASDTHDAQDAPQGRWRLLPATLFGRLALLLAVFALASHALALSLMFELHPPAPGPLPFPPPEHGEPFDPGPMPAAGLLLDVGVRLSALIFAAWIGARWLAAPIKRLADGARALGEDLGHAPLPVEGPQECQEAIRGFNHLQARIRAQLSDRDRFVAAVSHDLRTPLTRLRLRTESLADAAQHREFQRDIAEMDAMITATLDYLRGASDAEPWVAIDTAALAARLCEDRATLGQRATTAGAAAPVFAQASALQRCLGNLVDNAIRYGGGAEIVLIDSPSTLLIEVRDRGPGLPAHQLEKVLAPFYRFETSRNRQTGGVGLGLSIASDIARRHGGRLSLRNAPGGGLVAALQLPRAAGAGEGNRTPV